MSPLLAYLVYAATGAAAGLMSRLGGIGGGLVMVPALLACFALAGMPAECMSACKPSGSTSTARSAAEGLSR